MSEGSGGLEGGALTCGTPAALTPRLGARSFRIRAWMATWAAACEVREGTTPSTLDFTWEGARGRVTASPRKGTTEGSSCDYPYTTYP